MKDRITRAADGLRSRLKIRHAGIQTTITMSFTLIAGIYMILIGAILYSRFSVRSRDIMTENAGQFLTQTKRSVEDYLRFDLPRQFICSETISMLSVYHDRT